MSTQHRAQEALFEVLATRPHVNGTVPNLETNCPLCGRPHTEMATPYKFGSLDTLIQDFTGRDVGWYCGSCDEMVAHLFA